MEHINPDIALWFAGYLAGSLTEEQQAELEAWVVASEENRLLFEKVCREENLRKLNQMARAYHRQEAWRQLEKRLNPEKKTLNYRRWMGWAAVLLLPLSVSYFLLHLSPEIEKQEHLNTATVIHPGSSKAILTLGDGSVIDLKQADPLMLEERDGTRIQKDSAVLSYRKAKTGVAVPDVLVYNKVEIPRGGEYSLILCDGTVVYLNAMSSLRYPVNFAGDKREVELTGEAYFQVEKEAARPFIVKTGDLEIQVLGTEFNVCAYTDKQAVRTTLVKGSVQLHVDGQEPVLLKPSQQAKFNKNSGKIKVKEVDVSMYIAWKNGMFDIRDWKLEDIMDYLSRWYDVQVFYQNESLKKMRFGCYINRYSEIGPILDLFERTGKIRAELKGSTVVFSSK